MVYVHFYLFERLQLLTSKRGELERVQLLSHFTLLRFYAGTNQIEYTAGSDMRLRRMKWGRQKIGKDLNSECDDEKLHVVTMLPY